MMTSAENESTPLFLYLYIPVIWFIARGTQCRHAGIPQ